MWYYPAIGTAVYVLMFVSPGAYIIYEYFFGVGQFSIYYPLFKGIFVSMMPFVIGTVMVYPSYLTFGKEGKLIRDCEKIDWNPNTKLYQRSFLFPPLAISFMVYYTIKFYFEVWKPFLEHHQESPLN